MISKCRECHHEIMTASPPTTCTWCGEAMESEAVSTRPQYDPESVAALVEAVRAYLDHIDEASEAYYPRRCDTCRAVETALAALDALAKEAPE